MPTHPRDRGQILVVFVLSLVALMLVVGLVLDGSFAWVKQRNAQNAADFAALAGTRIVLQNLQGTARLDGDVATAIVNVATANGASVPGLGTAAGPLYTDGDGIPLSPTAFVGTTSSTAAIPANARGVTVTAATAWRPFMLGIIGVTNWTAGAGAIARVQPTGGSASCGLCVLGNFNMPNSSSVVVNNGGVEVKGDLTMPNSSSLTVNNGSMTVGGALNQPNSATITVSGGSVAVGGNATVSNSSKIAASNGSVSVGGNLSLSNSSTVTAQSVNVTGTSSAVNSSSVSPTPSTGVAVTVSPVVDPLAFLSQPTNPNPGATAQNYSCVNSCGSSSPMSISPGSGTIASVNVANSSKVQLSPGLYNNLSIANSSTVTLQPGTYYFAGSGGGATVDNSSKIIGSGAVTLVFLDQTSLNDANSTGLQITAPDPSLTANSTYPWPGMAIYYARGNTATLGLANSSSYPLTGTIYARDATLNIANSSAVGTNSLIVVGGYSAANSSPVTVTYNANQNVQFTGLLQLVQ